MPPCTLSRQYRMPVSDARQYRMPSHGHRASRTRARNVARVVVCSPSEARDELFVLGGGLRAGSDDKLPEEVVVVLSIPPVYYLLESGSITPTAVKRLQQASVRYLCCRPRVHVLAPSRLDASRLACGAWAAAGSSARQASGHDPQAGRAPTSRTQHLQTKRTHSRRTGSSARHASTDARRPVQLGRPECDERYPVRWKEVLLPIAA